MKVCKSCNTEKDFSCFYKRGESSYQHKCKDCENKYKSENKLRIKKYKSNHYIKNKGKYLLKAKESKSRNLKRWQEEFYKKHPEKKVIRNIRNRNSSFVNSIKNNKFASTYNMLGCNIETLKIYLESKFTKGMSWENYGKWHIDHIIPCAKFDLTKEEEQKICFHYTNLQPLWAKDNCSKQDRLIGKTQLNLIF